MKQPPHSFREALTRAADSLGEVLEREPELAASIRNLAEAWRQLHSPAPDTEPPGDHSGAAAVAAEAATDQEAPRVPPPSDEGEPPSTAEEQEMADRASREQLEDLVNAFSGDGIPTIAPESRKPPHQPASARLIADRCRLKQRACELVAELIESPEPASALREEIDTLIRQAKALEDCYLWMLRPEAREWVAAETWETLGHTFGNLARSMVLADVANGEGTDQERSEISEALALAAEAQRATRDAVEPCVAPGKNFEDSDQLAAFRWIAERCESLRVFIERHMKIDDPADPGAWESLLERIAAAEKRRKSRLERSRAEKQLRGKIAYEAKRLEEASSTEIDQRAEKIASATQELVDSGMPPSDTRLREVLLPVFDRLADAPDFEMEGYRMVLREVDRHVARLEAGDGTVAGPVEDGEIPEVATVRRLLRGRAVVLIGGEERAASAKRLKEAFGLSDLLWVATRPHEAIEALQPPILRDEVAVVLLAIRWTSHSFAGVRSFCEAAGKPLVRLPGGYGVNRVAAEIVSQASEALGGSR